MKIKSITVNAIIATLYIVITMLIQPIAFSNIQFRIPEIFNHLIIFNKKYFIGIIIGVFLANLLFSTLLPADLVFGVGHSIISLVVTLILSRITKNIWIKMGINTLVFSFFMFIIAYELNLVLNFPFLETYLFTAIGEFVVMIIGMPIMYLVNKKLNLKTILDN